MHRRVARMFVSIGQYLRFGFALLALLMHWQAHAANGMPPGTLGWYYYTGVFGPDEYAPDPATACHKTAMRHMGQPLKAIRPLNGLRSNYECKYAHFLRTGGIDWFGGTALVCEKGYRVSRQGVCLKDPAEIPVPLTCQGSAGNPVQFVSGAKVQHETDLVAGPGDGLRIGRTYRSVRQNGLGQSAGQGWSFSFERAFFAQRDPASTIRRVVSGSLPDGSYFQFSRESDGSYRSDFDRSMSLVMQGADAGWVLTMPDGTVERYAKSGDEFRLSSSHGRDGAVTHYAYDANNRLSEITDAGGRSVTLKWEGDVIASISGASGGCGMNTISSPFRATGPLKERSAWSACISSTVRERNLRRAPTTTRTPTSASC